MAYLLFIYNKTDKRNQRFQDFSQNSRIYRTQLQFVNGFFWTPFSCKSIYLSIIDQSIPLSRLKMPASTKLPPETILANPMQPSALTLTVSYFLHSCFSKWNDSKLLCPFISFWLSNYLLSIIPCWWIQCKHQLWFWQ